VTVSTEEGGNLHAKFRSQSTAEIKTFGFEKRTAAILEFYFRFRFRSVYCHRHAILHLPVKFRSNWTIVGRVMTLYPFFSRWLPAAILDLMWAMLVHSRSGFRSQLSVSAFGLSCICSSNLVLGRFMVLEILRFAIFVFAVLAKNCLFTPILGGFGGIFLPIWSPIVLTPKRTILAWKHIV